VTIEIFDGAGKPVKKFSSKAAEETPAPAPAEEGGRPRGGGTTRVPVEPGLNRFVWDFRYPDASRFPGMILWSGNTSGPRAVPGTYQVKLTVAGKSMSESFQVLKDPRIATTQEDLQKQFELLTKIRDKLSETHRAIVDIREIRKQLDDYSSRVAGQANSQPIIDAAKSLKAKITAIEEELYQTKNQSSQDPLNYPIRLNNKLAALAGVVASADAAPTDQSYTVYEELVGRIDAQLEKLKQVVASEVPAFNKLVRENDVPAVLVKPTR
ncbi:MAG: glycosyl hydrolase, partial [Blastocatellia bacterium]|nr:glycosyl hydrolase [Blastocatellia bacterium]